MQITFWGAAQEVTGSMHLIEVNGKRILLDCGLWQGKRALAYERNLNFPFDADTVDVMVLSHAHIDHSGNIPNLVKQGFEGPIFCTTPTRNLSTYMLMDSGNIQESDAAFVNKIRMRRGETPVEPMYTMADAQRSLSSFVTIGVRRPIPIAEGVELTFMPAGHILGAAWIQLDIREAGTSRSWRVVFSGDLGRSESQLLFPPALPDEADIVIMESTYGDRLHLPYDDANKKLQQIVNSTVRRRGKVIIPAFAIGRTQEVTYELNRLDEGGDIPQLPIYIDSPLAVNATDVFRMHPEEWNEEVQGFLVEERRRSPFDDINITYIRDVRESKRLNHLNSSAIIISASGMAENGRILHHLRNNIEDPNNTILLVSFQAQDTLGRKLQDGVDPVRIFGQEHDVRARVETIEGYSAHADQSELVRWASAFDPKRLQRVHLVHGEPQAANALQAVLKDAGVLNVNIPARGESVNY